MMKKCKNFALFLAVLMLASSFTACSEKKDEGQSPSETDSPVNESNVENVKETEAETSLLDTIPETNLDGRTVKAVTRGSGWWQFTDIDAEEITGEGLNDALFNRNAELEKRLNISFEVNQSYTDYGVLGQDIRTLISSGDSEYDIMIPFMNQGVQLAQEDLFLNLKNIDTLDLSNHAWDQNANVYFDIGGKLFFAISDISLAKNETIWTYMFNKRMINDYDLENPYDLVREGKWTFDKSFEMMEKVTNDVDGNGVMDANDIYGLATHEANYYALLIAGGEPVAGKDENNDVVLKAGNERFISVYDKIRQLFANKNDTIIEYQGESFIAGNSLLCGQVLACVRMYRVMEDDFGLIPLPKYDEAQNSYYSYVIPYEVAASVVPITAKDPEVSGTVLQALAILSEYYVTPAYYDITITGKGLRDEDSAAMLDIIRDSATYDLARMFDWGGIASGIPTSIMNDSEFTSFYKRRQKAVEKNLQVTIDNFINTKN